MSNFTTLCLGDFHIKDFQHKNQYLDKFEYTVALESFKIIYKIIEDNNINKLLILGDFTVVAPQAEAIELAHTFLKGLPQGLVVCRPSLPFPILRRGPFSPCVLGMLSRTIQMHRCKGGFPPPPFPTIPRRRL